MRKTKKKKNDSKLFFYVIVIIITFVLGYMLYQKHIENNRNLQHLKEEQIIKNITKHYNSLVTTTKETNIYDDYKNHTNTI